MFLRSSLCRAPSNRVHGAPFRPVRAMAVDLFPQTMHMEMLLLLERVDYSSQQQQQETVSWNCRELKAAVESSRSLWQAFQVLSWKRQFIKIMWNIFHFCSCQSIKLPLFFRHLSVFNTKVSSHSSRHFIQRIFSRDKTHQPSRSCCKYILYFLGNDNSQKQFICTTWRV